MQDGHDVKYFVHVLVFYQCISIIFYQDLNYFSSIMKGSHNFWTEYLKSAKQMTNVRLVTKQGKEIRTHALLLASCSSFLRLLLLDLREQEEIIILLPDCSLEQVLHTVFCFSFSSYFSGGGLSGGCPEGGGGERDERPCGNIGPRLRL